MNSQLIQQGRAAYRAGDFSAAAQILGAAKTPSEIMGEADHLRGNALMHLGMYAEAAEAYAAALNDGTYGKRGALLTNLTAWLSGVWFDLDLVGGAFKAIANVLPFVHAVELERAAFSGDWAAVPAQLGWVLLWALPVCALAVALFLRQMKRQ